VTTEGCAFVREMRALLQAVETHSGASGIDAEGGRELCGLIEAYAPARPVRPADGEAAEVCDPAFVVGETTLRLRLRSLDDIVYYVGELMRAGSMSAEPGNAIEAQVTVRAAGLRGGGKGVPLFRIVSASTANAANYAAEVEYAGARYFAGPAIGRSCAEAAASGRCRDDAEQGDRSSSVLSLIAELMALNQSPDAIRAPSRLITD
jgi:hypothetical protein